MNTLANRAYPGPQDSEKRVNRRLVGRIEGQVGHGTWNGQAGLLPLGPDPVSRNPTAWDPALNANDHKIAEDQMVGCVTHGIETGVYSPGEVVGWEAGGLLTRTVISRSVPLDADRVVRRMASGEPSEG